MGTFDAQLFVNIILQRIICVKCGQELPKTTLSTASYVLGLGDMPLWQMIKFNLQVEATDADVDRPNNIQYALSGSYSDRFQIDPNTGKSLIYQVSRFEE